MKNKDCLYRIIDESSGLYLGGKLTGQWTLSDKDYKTFKTLGACRAFLTNMRKEYNSGTRIWRDDVNPNNLKIAEFSIVLTRVL
jgi:hypothetical protein